MKKLVSQNVILASTVFALGALIPLAASANIVKREGPFTVRAGEVVEDNLIVVADSVDIQGEVLGDVIVAAGTVNIKGVVEGDVIGVSGDVTVKGNVGGDVRVLSGTTVIGGTVNGNVTVASGRALVEEGAEIRKGILAAAGTFELHGAVQRNVQGFFGKAYINAPIGGSVFVKIDKGGLLVLEENARVGGDVSYVSENDIERAAGAEVAGVVRRLAVSPEAESSVAVLLFFARVLSLLGLLAVGLFLANVFGAFTKQTAEAMLVEVPRKIFVGFAVFWLTPIVALLLMFTVIGIPLALMAFALYLVALYIAKVFAALAIGSYILKRARKETAHLALTLTLVLGGIVVVGISAIPVVGFIVSTLFVWWGVGTLFLAAYGAYRSGVKAA
jgi:cytoskeletal protein CcmA (bactofilin family)